MAEDYDPEALRELMRLIMKRLEVSTSGQLALKMQRTVARAYGEKTVRNWVKGENGPEYPSLMAMLSAAGLLAPEADTIWRGKTKRERELADAEETERRLRSARGSRHRRETESG